MATMLRLLHLTNYSTNFSSVYLHQHFKQDFSGSIPEQAYGTEMLFM